MALKVEMGNNAEKGRKFINLGTTIIWTKESQRKVGQKKKIKFSCHCIANMEIDGLKLLVKLKGGNFIFKIELIIV